MAREAGSAAGSWHGPGAQYTPPWQLPHLNSLNERGPVASVQGLARSLHPPRSQSMGTLRGGGPSSCCQAPGLWTGWHRPYALLKVLMPRTWALDPCHGTGRMKCAPSSSSPTALPPGTRHLLFLASLCPACTQILPQRGSFARNQNQRETQANENFGERPRHSHPRDGRSRSGRGCAREDVGQRAALYLGQTRAPHD